MGGHRTRLTVLSFGLAIAAAGLTGCAPEASAPPTTTAPSTEPTAAPSVEPSAEPTNDILFTITANVRAVDGRTIGVSMSAHAAVASTDPQAADLRKKFIDVCAAGTGLQPITEQYLRDNGSTLMRISISSTVSDLTFRTPIDLYFGSPYFAQAAIGQGIAPEPEGPACFNGFAWAKSGTVLGIADFENSDGKPDLNQWRYGRFGFFVKPTSGATIEACKVVLTDVGMKTDLTGLKGWNPSSAGDGISCKIGYLGE